MKKIPNQIESLLQNRKLQKTEFAKLLGVDPKTVHNWIKGRQYPSVKYIPKIMEILGVADINHIFFFEMSVKPDNTK